LLKGLRVQTVSAEYLLAMKLMSARYGEKDYDDIRFLLNKLEINSTYQAYEVVQSNRIRPLLTFRHTPEMSITLTRNGSRSKIIV
ncbi:MAG: hypothetical protein LBT08_10545, partial [Synergistaceae bacterium]|jgi:hypothetical protein|nr:hypothetical protein [Synergistaceae bacterium]